MEMTTTEMIKRAFESAFDEFDFEKVHAFMALTNWTWVIPYSAKCEVPSIEHMKSEVRKLFYNCLYELGGQEVYWLECGGFHIEINQTSKRVFISFTLTRASRYYN